jgi:hypothetical protein
MWREQIGGKGRKNFDAQSGAAMTLRSDHVAGAFFFLFGILVFAISGDLPFGTITAPGAGMMPKLMAGLMMVFAVCVAANPSDSKPFVTIDWSDRWHAILVVLITAVAAVAYRPLGFLITMSTLVFSLLALVEFRSKLLAPANKQEVMTIAGAMLALMALINAIERGQLAHIYLGVPIILIVAVLLVRRVVVVAGAYSIGLTLFAYWLFGKALKAPLERGLLWF